MRRVGSPSLASRLALPLFLLAAAGCSDPIVLDWRYDAPWGGVSTPLVTDDYVAIGGEGGVIILEPDGTRRCEFRSHGEVVAAVKTDGQRLYFGSTNYVFYAIGPQCQLIWKFATRDRIKSDPLIAGGVVYTASYDGHLYSLNAATGALRWTFPSSVPAPRSVGEADEPRLGGIKRSQQPRLDKSELQHTTERPAKTRGRRQGRRGDKTVSKRVRSQHRTPVSQPRPAALPQRRSVDETPNTPPALVAATPAPLQVDDFSYSGPVLADGVIYIGNLDHHIYAIDAANGTMRWRFETGGAITSTPWVHEGVVYFGSNDGFVYAVSVATQQQLWKHATGDWVNSSPRVQGGTVLIGSNDRHLYSLDLATGDVLWKFETKGPIVVTPAVYGNLVFAAGSSGDGTLYAIDATRRQLVWSFATGGKVDADPVVVGNRLFVFSTDRTLYAFRIVAAGLSS